MGADLSKKEKAMQEVGCDSVAVIQWECSLYSWIDLLTLTRNHTSNRRLKN